jgi:hypothetical protein
VLEATARSEGVTADSLVATAMTPIASFAAGQGPPTRKALDAILSFMQDWKQPKGPIKVSLTPAKSAGLSDLDKIGQPNALVDYFGLAVDYAGTRPLTPGAERPSQPPASGGAVAAAPSGGSTELGGAEAALSISGNTLVGRFEGEVVYELYRKDGRTALLEGSDISTGKWSIEGEKLCTKYPDEDKECYTVRRRGDEVTLTGATGKAYRLTLVPGNPKDL